jgi:hypothetical protein
VYELVGWQQAVAGGMAKLPARLVVADISLNIITTNKPNHFNEIGL